MNLTNYIDLNYHVAKCIMCRMYLDSPSNLIKFFIINHMDAGSKIGDYWKMRE